MERKLATIQVISELRPINGADKIEVALMQNLGWECVVKKGEFKVGDKIVYCEVDSVLPEKSEYEFLRDRKFRIRTIKLRGQISQGLILPLSVLDNYLEVPAGIEKIKKALTSGDNVTDYLKITKYLTPSEREELQQEERKLANEKNKLKKFMMRYSWFRRFWRNYVDGYKPARSWPYWCEHTNEERIQNIPHVLEQFKDKEVYVTEKIDYQSGTWTGKMIPRFGWLKLYDIHNYTFSQIKKIVKENKIPFICSGRYVLAKNFEQCVSKFPDYIPKKITWFRFLCRLLINKLPLQKYQFVVCSRNLTTNDKNSLYWKIARKYNLEQILRENPTLTIQGEQGDTKVQGNKYGIKEPTMWVFNIIDHEKNYHYNRFEMVFFCEKYDLPLVPLVYIKDKPYCKLSELGSTVQELVEFSKGKSVLADIPREGVVIRCIDDGKKLLSFKVINPDFLLKYYD